MKKITQLFTLLTLAFAFSINAQENCANAVAVTSGVTNTTTINNDGIQDAEMTLGGGFDAAWYTFTAPGAGSIDIESCLGGADTVLYVGTGTCGSLTSIAAVDDACDEGAGLGYAAALYDISVTNGTTYYIEWGDWYEDGPFDWTLTFTPAASCEVPSNVTADFLTDVQLDFSWSVPIAGTPVSYDWEIQPDGVAQGTPGALAGANTTSLSASSGAVLSAGTAYDLYIRTNCTAGSSVYLQLDFTTNAVPPPANDNACNAQPIIVSSAPATYSNEGATTETDEPGGNCWFIPNDISHSVWFEFTTQVADDITVSLDFAGGSLGDTQLAVYSGDCSNLAGLTEVGCDDDSGLGLLSTVTMANLAAGTYLVQVEGYNLDVGTFDIEITATNVLSVENLESNTEFTYYPNPVKNSLNFQAQNNIEDVTVYNLLGQEVLKVTPNDTIGMVDMSALTTGTYIAAVTINNVRKTIRVIKQ
jgi:Secretion system C-terminal sorting domain